MKRTSPSIPTESDTFPHASPALLKRNRGLFMLGVSTGGRISELLSLRIADV